MNALSSEHRETLDQRLHGKLTDVGSAVGVNAKIITVTGSMLQDMR